MCRSTCCFEFRFLPEAGACERPEVETALRKKPEGRLNRDLQAISSWLGQQVIEMRAAKEDSGGGGGGGDRSSIGVRLEVFFHRTWLSSGDECSASDQN